MMTVLPDAPQSSAERQKEPIFPEAGEMTPSRLRVAAKARRLLRRGRR